VEPDRSYSTVWVDRPSEHARTRLEEVPTGTRVLSRIDGVQSFWLSTMGLMFDVRSVVAARQSVTSRNFAKLKQILEAAPRQ